MRSARHARDRSACASRPRSSAPTASSTCGSRSSTTCGAARARSRSASRSARRSCSIAQHAPHALRGAPSLRLANGAPFDSDLVGRRLRHAARRRLSPGHGRDGQLRLRPRSARAARATAARTTRSREYTPGVLRRARARDGAAASTICSRQWPRGTPDCPTGIVGMTVSRGDLRRLGRIGPADRRVHGARHRDRAARDERSAPHACRRRSRRWSCRSIANDWLHSVAVTIVRNLTCDVFATKNSPRGLLPT